MTHIIPSVASVTGYNRINNELEIIKNPIKLSGSLEVR